MPPENHTGIFVCYTMRSSESFPKIVRPCRRKKRPAYQFLWHLFYPMAKPKQGIHTYYNCVSLLLSTSLDSWRALRIIQVLTKTDKWQTRPLVREGAPQRQGSNFEKKNSGQKSQIGLDTKTYWLTDRQS
jgi:hypothetical protein